MCLCVYGSPVLVLASALAVAKSINKRLIGVTMLEVLVASRVIQSGSGDQAMRGKDLNRIIRCHSLMREMLLIVFVKRTQFQDNRRREGKIR